jgi:hypothetical protein
MNEPKDTEAAETGQTESIEAVDPAAICSPVRDDIFGWFGDAAQTEPEHDPGPDAPCPICGHSVGRHSVDNPIKTISLMVEDPAKRRNSFFFRAHKRCWEMVSDHERSMVESALIDHIVDADKMVAPEHHFRDAAKMVGLLRPDSADHGSCAAAFCYASSIRRWNFETRGGEIWVCEGDHEKSESCITNSREVFACEAIEIIERLRSESLETIQHNT